MIATAVEREIHDLLAAGDLSQRKIARRLGVSRGTVHAIARRKRSACSSRRRPACSSGRDVPSDEFIAPAGLPQRCPGCGGMVRMPCLLCRLRATDRRRSN